jgi:hypothetical protein
MATIPQLNVRQVDNLVLYSGPLNGALIADSRVFQSLIVGAAKLSGVK